MKLQIVNLPDPDTLSYELVRIRLEAFQLKLQSKQYEQASETEDRWAAYTNERLGKGRNSHRGLSYKTQDRIRKRAHALVRARRKAAGLARLKEEDLADIFALARGVNATALRDVDHADEIAAALHDEAPWLSEVSTAIWHQLRRIAEDQRPVTLRPLLVVGPPGSGKSFMARRLAELLAVPSVSIDASTGSAGFAIAGVERGWSSAMPGRPVDTLMRHHIANPVVIVDEICKARSYQSIAGSAHVFSETLLSMLEPMSARAWECPYFRLPFDLSHITWVLTANSLETVPEPLLNRCQIVHVSALCTNDLVDFAKRRGAEMGLPMPAIAATITLIERQTSLTRPLSLRDVLRMLDHVAALSRLPIVH